MKRRTQSAATTAAGTGAAEAVTAKVRELPIDDVVTRAAGCATTGG
jgi:hypothetical protein